MKKIKNKSFIQPETRIQFHTSKDIPPEQQPPKFSLRFLNKHYCISNCEKNEKVSFVNKIHLLSQKTWAELKQADRHGLGYEIIERSSIKSSIPSHLTNDVNIIAFRFHDKAPMVGYRDTDGTFYIIWFDRNFTLYKH